MYYESTYISFIIKVYWLTFSHDFWHDPVTILQQDEISSGNRNSNVI